MSQEDRRYRSRKRQTRDLASLPANREFSSDDVANMTDDQIFDEMKMIRWPETGGKPVCPECGHQEHTFISTRRKFKCKACHWQYSCTSGTPFSSTKLPYRAILRTMAEFAEEGFGLPARTVMRRRKVNAKTAWFLMQRIRETLVPEVQGIDFQGAVEVDASTIGDAIRKGNLKKRPADGRRSGAQGKNKAWVTTIVERKTNGRAVSKVFGGESEGAKWARQRVPQTSEVYTDEHSSYTIFGLTHRHKTINHSQCYYTPEADTNTVESTFGVFKGLARRHRRIWGRYLDLYVAEYNWRWNNRNVFGREKFRAVGAGLGRAGRSRLVNYGVRRASGASL